MRRDETPGSSGWAWGSPGQPARRAPTYRSLGGGGMAGTWLAVGIFAAAIAGGVAYFINAVRNEGTTTADPTVSVADATQSGVDATGHVDASPSAPVDDTPKVEPSHPPPPPDDADHPRSLDLITWTLATPATIDELVQTWSIPQPTLVALNPTLSITEPLVAGTRVVVHSGSIGNAESVGPPNDGHLVNGVPFPEGRTWFLAPDRSRAFGTGETIVSVLAALDSYAAKNEGAAPVQLGEISARKGGPISGHQSHQAGRDIDVRLVHDATGEGFDPALNWSLVRTFLDKGDVVAIYLNRIQQVWLRTAAETDVGVDAATRYFEIIKHEPGHIIHFHVRFRCPDSDHRCVAYTVGEIEDEGEKKPSKLPTRGGGGGLVRKKGKLPTLHPKTKPR